MRLHLAPLNNSCISECNMQGLFAVSFSLAKAPFQRIIERVKLSPLSRCPRWFTSPLCAPLQSHSSPPSPPVCSTPDWVQPLRLEARVYLEAKRKAIQELRAARWRKAPLRALGGNCQEDRAARGFELYRINSGLWGRAGSHGDVLRALGALAVPAFDIILSPGKRLVIPFLPSCLHRHWNGKMWRLVHRLNLPADCQMKMMPVSVFYCSFRPDLPALCWGTFGFHSMMRVNAWFTQLRVMRVSHVSPLCFCCIYQPYQGLIACRWLSLSQQCL